MIVGIKSGTFRIIHAGHIWMFNECKKQCDYLIVLTNDDEYISNHKRVITTLHERIAVLKGLKFIDEVHSFSGYTEEYWIEEFAKNRLKTEFGTDSRLRVFHTAELRNQTHIPAQYIADDIVFINRIPGSTTDIIENIRKMK